MSRVWYHFSAFIADESIQFLFDNVFSRFEVTRLRLTASRRKVGEIRGFSHGRILGVGKNFPQVGLQA